MNYYKLDVQHQNILHDKVVKGLFLNLSGTESTFMVEQLLVILEHMIKRFLIEDDQFFKKLLENNYLDAKALLLLLLPFIDDDDYNTKKNNITSLRQLYISKIPPKDNSPININKMQPKYIYCNVQYGRCIRGNSITEKEFDMSHILHNVELLKETINITANRMYVNWLHVVPLADYSTSKLYNVTVGQWANMFNNTNLSMDDINNFEGFYIGHFYDTIVNYLYVHVLPFRWLMYEYDDTTSSPQKLIMLYDFLKGKFDFKHTSTEMTDTELNITKSIWKSLISNKLSRQMANNIIYFFLKDNSNLVDRLSIDLENSKNRLWEYGESLPFNKIYDFIRYKMIHYENSWIGRMDDDINTFLEVPTNQTQKYWITKKNLYNFVKSLIIIKYSSGTTPSIKMPFFWQSLNENDKLQVMKKLTTIYRWFNIRKNLLRRHVAPNDIAYTNRFIHQSICKNLVKVVFDIQHKNGLLTSFVYFPQITDNSNLPVDENKRRRAKLDGINKYVLNSNQLKMWENCYYFIDNKKYGEHFLNKKDEKLDTKYPYLSVLTFRSIWPTMYAMDWIVQIALFHKYLHCRVIYTTGSTGTGKSTQVPKILLYSTKMISYNPTGRVVCTQPRIAPVTSNTQEISRQMGVPITEFNSKVNENIRSSNYSLQYKYKEGSHTMSIPTPSLLFCTDGTLLEQIKKSPLLKNQVDKTFTINNMYDIVIVDESHEHNKNMDLILTNMKYTSYYNNNIKLVIISATMDDDEPIYRRYYRDINDNLTYPFAQYLPLRSLDRINIDRRVHISPIGATTMYKIHEFYVENATPMELILKIVASSTIGDILVFQAGENDIKKLVRLINSSPLPLLNSTIALPYYSNMREDRKNFIENLSRESTRRLRVSKEVDYNNPDSTKKDLVPEGSYNRVIIVATNIAEASITIDTLKFVIDNGKRKTNYYDYINDTTNLVTEDISESSRKQRKGRVGRVDSGTVYYTYPKGQMENNPIVSEISVADLTMSLYSAIGTSSIYYFTQTTDPNQKISMSSINRLRYGLKEIIYSQYFYKDRQIVYQGQSEQYDYEFKQSPPNIQTDGYDYKILLDKDGVFYIVHPDELDLVRNIVGTIVLHKKPEELNTEGDFAGVSKKMAFFFENMINNKLGFVLDDVFYKSNIGLMVNKMAEAASLGHKESLALVHSKVFHCNASILRIIPALSITLLSWFDLSAVKDNDASLKFLSKNFANNIGDIRTLDIITKMIVNSFETYATKLAVASPGTDYTLLFLQGAWDKLPLTVLNKMLKLKHAGLLKPDAGADVVTKYFPYSQKYISSDVMSQYVPLIETFSKQNGLNNISVTTYLKNYYRLLENSEEYEYIENYTFPNSDPNINSTLAIMVGFNNNIVHQIARNKYQRFNSPKVFSILETTIAQGLPQYLHYINIDSSKDTISIVSTVNMETALRLIPFRYANYFPIDIRPYVLLANSDNPNYSKFISKYFKKVATRR